MRKADPTARQQRLQIGLEQIEEPLRQFDDISRSLNPRAGFLDRWSVPLGGWLSSRWCCRCHCRRPGSEPMADDWNRAIEQGDRMNHRRRH